MGWLDRLFNPPATASRGPADEVPARRGRDLDDLAAFCPPPTMTDAAAWDEFWRVRFEGEVAIGAAESYMFAEPAEIGRVLAANRLLSILCVGSGASVEPWAFARAGYVVTALDLSPYALQKAQEAQPEPFPNLRYVVGDLMDERVCPGPYDVILERRTLQLYQPPELHQAMTRVAGRLATRGLFYSHCHDGAGRPGAGRNPTRDWFVEHGWTLYRGDPITGRVAWTFSSTG